MAALSLFELPSTGNYIFVGSIQRPASPLPSSSQGYVATTISPTNGVVIQLSSSSFWCISKSSLRRHYRVTLVYTASNITIFASEQSWRSYPHTANVRHDLLIDSSSSLALFTRSTNLLGRKKAGGSSTSALTLSPYGSPRRPS